MKTKGFLKKAMLAAVLALPAASINIHDANAFFGPGANMSQQSPQASPESYSHKTLASENTSPVGVQLVLAMDTSSSMSDEEFNVQLKATADAINSELFRNAIKYKTGEPSVAISVIDFDSVAELRLGWADIRGDEINDKPYNPDFPADSSAEPDKLDTLAKEIEMLPRRGSGGTTIQMALMLGKKLYENAPWPVAEGGKRVLDLFGDGSGNPEAMRAWRDQLAFEGVTINGFAIVNEEPNLERHFKNALITKRFIRSTNGIVSEPGRVWAVARNMQSENNTQQELKSFTGDVTTAMKQKLTVELAGVNDYRRILVMLDRKPAFILPTLALVNN